MGYIGNIMMETKMIDMNEFQISEEAETLLETLGYEWNGWGYIAQDFLEINGELEANGVPSYKTFEEFLRRKLEWKQSLKSDMIDEKEVA
jgi:hypothetical protein